MNNSLLINRFLLIRIAIIVPSILLSNPVMAQIKGMVYDAEVLAPLHGAVVTTQREQTITASDGRFILNSQTKERLIISHLGYKTDTLFTEDSISVILLEPDYTHMDQVIIHGPLLHHNLLEMPSSMVLLHNMDFRYASSLSFVGQLNQLAGIYVHNGHLNTNRITIRGIGSRTPYATNRVKAYFNEIPLTNGDGTTVIDSTFNPDYFQFCSINTPENNI